MSFLSVLLAFAMWGLSPSPSAVAASVTYNSGNVNMPIPDMGTVTSTLPVQDAVQIEDINATINITHTYDSDLRIYLIAPNGTQVTLSANRGGSGDNYTNTVFDDEALTAIGAGAAPFTGSFRPEGFLSTLDGTYADGTWKLEVHDVAGGDTGTLLSWSITITFTKADTTTSITSAPTSTAGSPVTINYTTVSAAAGRPTGTVTVSDGAVICTGDVAAGGCPITFYAAGTTTLTATYSGDNFFNGSAGGATHTTDAMPATAILTPSSLNAGTLAVGSTGISQAAVLTNTGGSSLGITGIPSGAGDFSATHNCPGSLAVNAQCIISLTFSPTAPGDRSTTLTIATSAGDRSLSLAGTGTIAAGSIVIDPAVPSILYAGLDGAGIYKSLDSGSNWTPATTQPTNLRVKALVIKPGDSTQLFAATYGGGVFKSENSGVDWAVCADTNLANLNVVSLTIDTTGKLYAGTEAGVFVSTDNCATWTATNAGLPN